MESMNLFGSSTKYVSFIKETMLQEISARYKNGLYAFTQKSLAFNSSHAEGCTLSEEQISTLFDTGVVVSSGVILAREIEEMEGHFWMFSEMLKSLESPLTEDLIKHFHFCLKNNVFSYRENGYVAGEYKRKPLGSSNEKIMDDPTAFFHDRFKWLLEEVDTQSNPSIDVHQILDEYNEKQNKTLVDVVGLYANFEYIAPFQYGNVKVARLLLFRETLRNGFVPPVISYKKYIGYREAILAAHQGDCDKLLCLVQEAQESYLEQVKYFMGE